MLVAKDAPKETVDFAKVWFGKEIQNKLAEARVCTIPVVKGTADVIKQPVLQADRPRGREFAVDCNSDRSTAGTRHRSCV